MYDIVTIGSATLDIFVKSREFMVMPSEKVPNGVVLCEAYGAKIEVDQLHMLSGGGATNAGVTFTKNNLKTAVIAEIGKDLPSKAVIEDLNGYGLDTSLLVQEQDESTATSIILVSPEGGRSIVTCRGASKMLEVRDIPWDKLKTEWLYVSSLGGQIEVLEAISRFAQEQHIKLAVNPGGGELALAEKLKELIQSFEILILNQEEAGTLLGINFTQQPERLAECKKLGAQTTLITRGKEGAQIYGSDYAYYAPASEKEAIESTGAGDAFGSGFVTGQALGWDPIKSIQFAAANAENVIMYMGAKQGIISKADFLSSSPVKVQSI